MFRINLKRTIATVSVIASALAVAGPASASSNPLQNSMVSGAVLAPSGQASVAEHARGFIESQYVPTSVVVISTAQARFKSLSGMDSETEFMDYTDDALLDSARATGLKLETEVTDYLHRGTASDIDVSGLDRRMFSGDAYDNEMGITEALVARPNSELRPH